MPVLTIALVLFATMIWGTLWKAANFGEVCKHDEFMRVMHHQLGFQSKPLAGCTNGAGCASVELTDVTSSGTLGRAGFHSGDILTPVEGGTCFANAMMKRQGKSLVVDVSSDAGNPERRSASRRRLSIPVPVVPPAP